MHEHRWSTRSAPPRGLVRPVRVDPEGVLGPTPGMATGPRWRRTSQGFHVPVEVDGARPEQRALEQSVRLPSGGAVTGWAALRLAGANFFDGMAPDGVTPLPVQLAVGSRKIRADPAVVVSREPLAEAEVVVRHGVPCTRVTRALFDEMRRATDAREAVVAMDMAAAADLVSVTQMKAYLAQRSRWRRTRQVSFALRLASERSRSPNETRMRLIWVLDARLPTPLVNQDVFSRGGRLIGVPDLFDPIAGVVAEYDGADHRRARRHSRDVARAEDFRRVGLEYLTVTGPDVPRRRIAAERMLTTRARALFLPDRDRAWTTTPPPGWPLAPSLDELLAHRALMAELHSSG